MMIADTAFRGQRFREVMRIMHVCAIALAALLGKDVRRRRRLA